MIGLIVGLLVSKGTVILDAVLDDVNSLLKSYGLFPNRGRNIDKATEVERESEIHAYPCLLFAIMTMNDIMHAMLTSGTDEVVLAFFIVVDDENDDDDNDDAATDDDANDGDDENIFTTCAYFAFENGSQLKEHLSQILPA